MGSSFDASLAAPAGSSPSPSDAAAAQLSQLQALLQGTGSAGVTDPNDPRSAALRAAIERANGVPPTQP